MQIKTYIFRKLLFFKVYNLAEPIRIDLKEFHTAKEYKIPKSTALMEKNFILHKNSLLIENGILLIDKGFTWDGATCAIDTKAFVKASLVHDALYRLMTLGHIENNHHNRLFADLLMKEINLKYGMAKIRAWYSYLIVRWFGNKAATKPMKIYTF